MLVAGDRREAREATSGASGEVFFIEESGGKIRRIDPDGMIGEFVDAAERADGLSVGPRGEPFAVPAETGKVVRHDPSGKGSLVVEGLRGRHVLATPGGGLDITAQGEKPGDPGEVWFVEGGRKARVDSGLKRATGLAYRPDRWLLSVADGGSKWAYSDQIRPDGTLDHKERFSWLHVPDWEDDAGAEAVSYAREGPMLVATRWGIQACADDGPTQAILPLPGDARPLGVCLGGGDMDTLHAFTGDQIWRRKVKVHGVGAFTPWTPVHPSKR